MFGMSLAEIGIIFLIALVFLGPEKIPELARMLGKTMREVRKAGAMLRDALEFEEERERLRELRAEYDQTIRSFDKYTNPLDGAWDEEDEEALLAHEEPPPHGDGEAPHGALPLGTERAKRRVRLPARGPGDGAARQVTMVPGRAVEHSAEYVEVYLHEPLALAPMHRAAS